VFKNSEKPQPLTKESAAVDNGSSGRRTAEPVAVGKRLGPYEILGLRAQAEWKKFFAPKIYDSNAK